MENLNQLIWTSPPIFLQTVEGQVTGLYTPPVIVSPHVTLTAGPQVNGNALLWLDLSADFGHLREA